MNTRAFAFEGYDALRRTDINIHGEKSANPFSFEAPTRISSPRSRELGHTDVYIRITELRAETTLAFPSLSLSHWSGCSGEIREKLCPYTTLLLLQECSRAEGFFPFSCPQQRLTTSFCYPHFFPFFSFRILRLSQFCSCCHFIPFPLPLHSFSPFSSLAPLPLLAVYGISR